MRRCLALLALCLFCCAPAWSEPPRELVEAYQNLGQAWENLSVSEIMQTYAPEARLLDGRGKWLDHAGIEATVRDALEGALTCKNQYEIVSCQESEGRLVARVHQTRNIGYGDKRVWRVVDREDTWRRGPEGWRVAEIRFLSQTATITGTGADARRSR